MILSTTIEALPLGGRDIALSSFQPRPDVKVRATNDVGLVVDT